jgi:pimeloyl-ACP methyl ester carboxylesterase
MVKVKIHRHLVELGSTSIFYRDTETIGQAILCLHGRWGRGETWIDFMHHYGSQYRVVAPDQRGHGLSSKPIGKYTAEEMSADMLRLLEYLRIESAIVVGHSMGGYIAGYMAANRPNNVDGLAILDKSAAGPSKANKLPPLAAIEVVDPVTKDWPLPFASLKEAQERIRADMHSDLSYQYFMDSLLETVEGYGMMFSTQAIAANIAYYQEWFDLLPRIRCPVLLLRANGGEAVNDEDFSRMKSLITDCMTHEIANPDHNVYLSDKEEFYRALGELLKKANGHKAKKPNKSLEPIP